MRGLLDVYGIGLAAVEEKAEGISTGIIDQLLRQFLLWFISDYPSDSFHFSCDLSVQ